MALPVTDKTPNLTLEITGRIVVGQSQLMRKLAATSQPVSQDLQKQLQANLLEMTNSPPDKLKAIVAIRELSGTAKAIELLDGAGELSCGSSHHPGGCSYAEKDTTSPGQPAFRNLQRSW